MIARSLVFNVELAEELKKLGVEAACATRRELLALASRLGAYSAAQRGCASIDDVQDKLIELGYEPSQLGNAAGQVFCSSQFEFVHFVQSKRVSNHRRWIRLWRLR